MMSLQDGHIVVRTLLHCAVTTLHCGLVEQRGIDPSVLIRKVFLSQK